MFEYYKEEKLRKILQNARFFSTMFTIHFLMLLHAFLTHYDLGLIIWIKGYWVWEVEEGKFRPRGARHGGIKAVGENKEKEVYGVWRDSGVERC